MKIFRFALDLLWIAMTRWMVIVVMITVALVVFRYDVTQFFFPRDEKNLSPSSRLVDDAAGEVARNIVLQCPPQEKSYSQLLVLPVRGDRENAIENMIRKEFQKQADSGWYKLVEKDVMTRVLDQVELLSFGKDSQKEITKDDAIRIARAAGAEMVLLSQVDRFVPDNGGHEISGTSQLIDVATGKTISISFDNSEHNDMMFSVGGWRSYVVLVLFALLWPILMIPVLRQVVARENNRDNYMTMLIMAAVPLVVTSLYAGTLPTSVFVLIGYCVLFALTAGWVGFVMDKIAKK